MEIIRTQPINRSAQGVQAFVGRCEYNGEPSIYKYSRNIDYVIDLEYDAWSSLTALKLPHFCEIFGKEVVSMKKKTCIFMKFIPYESLSQFIMDEKSHPKAMLTSVYQILATIAAYQEIYNITHYDLHADNVMMNHTDKDIHVYKFPDGEIFTFETFGWCPVIIDLGMAYLPNSPLRGTIAFSNCGFTPFCSDKLVDARLLLATVTNDITNRRSKKKRKYKAKSTMGEELIGSFKKALKTIFSKIPMRDNGWFKDSTFTNARQHIISYLPVNLVDMRYSSVFDPYTIEWALEIILSKVILPLRQTVLPKDTNLKKEFTLFFVEWLVVEDSLRNGTKELEFLKDILDMSPKSVATKYSKIKNIPELTKRLGLMIDGIEEALYVCQTNINAKKTKIYNKLPVNTTRDVLRQLPSIPVKYQTSQKIAFFDIDDPSKNSEVTLTTSQVEDLITGKINISSFFAV